ncbi:MAG: hypothetical protein U0L83_02415 [Muribaculaceae bacterium]|nr:hypothetical protein [Muribaculaceae bacterium]
MITESKVTEIFCIADDFCKEFEVEMAKNALPSSPDAPKRRRKRMMSDAEVITILIRFHFNTYRNFNHLFILISASSSSVRNIEAVLKYVKFLEIHETSGGIYPY